MSNINNYTKVKEIIKNAKYLVVFTGAGISVESGIPVFTGNHGLWSKYDPKFIQLSYFFNHPNHSWQEIKKIFYDHMLNKAQPNLAHLTIGKWFKQGIVKTVITQNIDHLHQKGGCNNIVEFHGTTKTISCTKCHTKYEASEIDLNILPPKCKKCGGLLKPDFIFYGEGIKNDVYQSTIKEILKADVILIVGTSGQVMPANYLPIMAKQQNNPVIIEVNPSKSSFTNEIVDYYFDTKATEFFKMLNL